MQQQTSILCKGFLKILRKKILDYDLQLNKSQHRLLYLHGPTLRILKKKNHLRNVKSKYRISANKRCPLISAALLGIHIETTATPLISPGLLNAALIRIVTMF